MWHGKIGLTRHFWLCCPAVAHAKVPQSAVSPNRGNGLVQRGDGLPQIDCGDVRVLLRRLEVRVTGEGLH